MLLRRLVLVFHRHPTSPTTTAARFETRHRMGEIAAPSPVVPPIPSSSIPRTVSAPTPPIVPPPAPTTSPEQARPAPRPHPVLPRAPNMHAMRRRIAPRAHKPRDLERRRRRIRAPPIPPSATAVI
ncbi:hypothetical protein BOTBODRAFT_28028 [Botryobasidium botryosum FD-172 SS1]|uniref:Uncharacterized protein n=1 Tax=Botryobasidium botryosum (strain FD-172 SS1) TaxID=930990 RepID=A0A067MV26_BOTB1|nr:hypothetical protein BOTBODRAFT_28028 [Botryobasidium botryosum FD-172 SS1]